MSDRETIDRAAIFYNGVIYSAPRPGRHHTVIAMMAADGFPNEAMSLRNQDFVTSANASSIATKAPASRELPGKSFASRRRPTC